MSDPYAALGVGYAGARRPDPRIAARVAEALAGAATVVDVGAGTGSYEPAGRTVLAVDPSPTMIGQRPPGSAPAVRARAEALPLPDKACDAAMAMLTVHHWTDAERGLAELVRVAHRQVVLTWDPAVTARFWLVADYVPEIALAERGLACVDVVCDALGSTDVRTVPVPADCTDGFLAAYWRRPEAYLDPDVRRSASGLARLPSSVLVPALRRLESDLRDGTWHARHGDLLERDELDAGYRLVVAGRRFPRRDARDGELVIDDSP
jgi:SAM-dependent methyltransferase